jgi:hypothetical protein
MFGFLPDFRAPADPQRYFLGFLVAILTAALYITLIVTIDNTNLGTTNGLWKAPQVSDWEYGRARPVDDGEYLYTDLYGHLARVVPDSWLRYGTAPRDVTFRKMAILNGVLGGVAAGCVFVLGLLITSSRLVSVAIWILHAGAGFVLLNSINSEDIIPAYTCIVAAVLCLIEFFQTASIISFILSAVLVGLATLLHWSTFPPAFAALVVVCAFLLLKHPRFFWTGALWLTVFLSSIKLMILAVLPEFKKLPLGTVLLPGKANAAGWVGLFVEKIWFFLLGVGNYFSGANNLSNFRSALESSSVFRSMIISWMVLAIALGSCCAAALRPSTRPIPRILSIFALVMFAVGEAGAIYSQPQDPQMQIEPMFVVIAGMLLLPWANRILRRAAVGAVVLFALNGAWNVHLMMPQRGLDSRAIADVTEINRLFPKETTVVVCQGMEGWITWQYVFFWDGHSAEWMKRNFQLARPFTTVRGISGDAAAEMMEAEINDARSHGLRVVASALWTTPENEAVGSYTTVTTEANAKVFVAKLRHDIPIGQQWNTPIGPFVELLPSNAPESGAAAFVRR